MAQQNKLIDLATFRKIHGLKQSDVANYLGITRGYISIVESSSGKLSEENLVKLMDRWGPTGLVPCYQRLTDLEEALKKDGWIHASESLLFDPYEWFLPNDIVSGIRYGRIGITEEIADRIVAKFGFVSKEWLMTGEGGMFVQKDSTRLLSIERKLSKALVMLSAIVKAMNIDISGIPVEDTDA